MASAFIRTLLARGEGVVKKSTLCTLAKKLKIVDHPLLNNIHLIFLFFNLIFIDLLTLAIHIKCSNYL